MRSIVDDAQHARHAQMESWLREHTLLGPMGVRFERYEPDHVVMRLPFNAGLTNDGIRFHGGIIATAIDTAGAGAALSSYGAGQPFRTATVSMSIQFVDAAKSSDLVCEARTVRRAKELVFTEITVCDDHDNVVAHALQTYRIVMVAP